MPCTSSLELHCPVLCTVQTAILMSPIVGLLVRTNEEHGSKKSIVYKLRWGQDTPLLPVPQTDEVIILLEYHLYY